MPADFTDFVSNEVERPIRIGSSLPTTCRANSFFFNVTTGKLYVSFTANNWTEVINSGGVGEQIDAPSVTVDDEIVLYSGTGGHTLKRASGTGFVKVSSGVMQTPAATLGSSEIDAAIVQKISVNVTSAQLKDLFDTPVTIIAAPGANKVIQLVDVASKLIFGTAAYVNGAGGVPGVYLTYGGVAAVKASNNLWGNTVFNNFLKSSAEAYFLQTATLTGSLGDAVAFTASQIVDKSITLQEVVAQNRELVTGDSTIRLIINYRVIDFS